MLSDAGGDSVGAAPAVQFLVEDSASMVSSEAVVVAGAGRQHDVAGLDVV
jgi:hypothetical protein